MSTAFPNFASSSGACFTLPTELWLLCLTYLPREDIRNLFSVSRLFRRVCFEPLFENITWTKLIPESLWRSPDTAPAILDDTTASLKSFMTDKGASEARPVVQRLEFKGIKQFICMTILSPQIVEGCEALLDAFYAGLGSFMGLRSLKLSNIIIHDGLLQTLTHLLTLEDLELKDCDITCRTKSQLRLRSLHLTQSSRSVFPKSNTAILPITSLENLVLEDRRCTSAVLSSWGAETFPSLTHLTAFIESSQRDLFFNFLYRCPQLSSLRLTCDSSFQVLEEPLPSNVIPNLTSYEGPLHLAGAFVANRDISSARVELVQLNESNGKVDVVSSAVALSGLRSIMQTAPHLGSLRLTQVRPDPRLLRIIASHLRELRSLEIRLDGTQGHGWCEDPWTSQHLISSSARNAALRISDLTGIAVDRSTGLPLDLPTSAQGLLAWTVLGKVSLPATIEDFSVYNPSDVPDVSIGLDVPRVLAYLSGVYPKLRSLGLDGRTWVRRAGDCTRQALWCEL
ncbi:hypothetical protein HYDPIDRAFT_113427 [Hydnomerulius pinastri MD-312]|uniref:F-box domain-containing protein n=1 Tax=Hydnomerulius pinastri MD-312 TaxID=994086 RepID=A0A0C9WEK2_9AGAM|nr:hypothetical protein HYDPIDRAFT_113427 [Hydnomerulius pinastri MD-312]